MNISVTERSLFKECRRKWFLEKRHRLAPTNNPGWSTIGHLVHEWLSKYHTKDTSKEWLTNEINRAIIEGNNDEEIFAGNIMKNYLSIYTEPTILEGVEVDFNREVYNTEGEHLGTVMGRIDGYQRSKDGSVILWEHKTSSSKYDPMSTLYHDQAITYLWLMTPSFVRQPTTVNFNILLKKLPTIPKPTKSGLSRAKISTTLEIYDAALEELGLDKEDYSEIRRHIEENPCELVQQFHTTFPVEQIDQVGKHLVHELNSIRSTLTWDSAYPSLSKYTCPSCPFSILCSRIYTERGFLKALNSVERFGLRRKEDDEK